MPYNLYTLRHEKRDQTKPLFDSPLLPEGHIKAQNILLEKLKYYNIDVIYTSPFLRCIDTVMPYAKECDIPVHIDYNLYEWLTHPDFKDKEIGKLEFVEKYESISNENIEIRYPEKSISRQSRVNSFMQMLDSKYQDTNANVLVCSHMDIVHDIIQIKEKHWPRGYLAMGTIIDLQNIKQHITSTLVIYAQFCNYIIPVLRYSLYIIKYQNSLKESANNVIKQCKFSHSPSMNIRAKDSIGWFRKNTTQAFYTGNRWLKAVFLQMRLVLAKQ